MSKPANKTATPHDAQSRDAAAHDPRGANSAVGATGGGLQQSPRQLAQLQALQQAFGPVAQLRSQGDPLHGPAEVVVQPGEGVIQAQWETALLYLLSSAVTAAVGFAAAYHWWWPAGWTLTQLRALHQHVAVRDILAFAALPWAPAAVIGLGQAYAAAPNNLSAAEWLAIAQALPANATVDAAAFAQIAGWNAVQINPLVADYAAHPAVAPAALWATIAAALPPASWAIVRPMAGAAPALTPVQIARGDLIYQNSGNSLPNVVGWIARGARAAVAPMAPLVPVIGPLLPGALAAVAGGGGPYAMDGVLGLGAHVQIRTAIAGARPYGPAPFVLGHANTLLAAGMTVGNTLTLLTDFCTNVATNADFNQCVAVAVVLRQNLVAYAELRNFFLLHLATAVQPALQPAIADLSARPGVTAALLNQILTTLAPMGHPALLNFLNTQLANTAGLTLARVNARVAFFTNPAGVPLVPGLGLAPAGIVGNQFNGLYQSLNARVLAGTMSGAARDWIKHAHKLLSQGTEAGMLAFLGSAAVAGTLINGAATNAAYWLYLLARQSRGAPPGGFVAVNVGVMAGGAMRTIQIDNNIIQHVLERHSYEHFRLTLPIINRHVTSALFTVAQTPLTVTNSITASVTSATFTGQHPWPLGVDIQVGALQLRLVQVAPHTYRVSQYFIQVAPGLAHDVTQGVLLQVRQRFPFLVY